MVIYSKNCGESIKHNCKTVKEFIENELEKIEDREENYYKLSIKNSYEDMKNIILYYQDDVLKSHHTTGKRFEYKDVLNHEILGYYTLQKLRVENIKSVDFNNIEELKEHKNSNSTKEDNNIFLEYKILKLEERIEKQKQQIKWLEKTR